MVTDKQLANLKPAKKGEVRNPKGRPPKNLSLISCLKEELAKVDKHTGKTNAQLIAERMVADAKDGDKGQSLVPVKPGEKVNTDAVDSKGLKTRPPARYSEATLLGAMEGAGKLVDDDELREAMQEKGLGTPATRAATIEGLINFLRKATLPLRQYSRFNRSTRGSNPVKPCYVLFNC